MGKIFDAIQKATFVTQDGTSSGEKEQTKEVSSTAKEIVDTLLLKPQLERPSNGENGFQLTPTDELLVSYKHNGGRAENFAAEQFKMLHSQLLFPRGRPVPKTIMVTSAIEGEGKSVVASNLAITLALRNQEHVLLMECDLRKPSMSGLFGFKNTKGLSDYLLEQDELSNLLCKTAVDRLTLLPAGQLAGSHYELLSSQRMIKLLEEVKNRYQDRYVIVDSTPAQVAAETSVLSRFIDGIILVVRYGKSSRKLIQSTMEKIGEEKFLGVVFNVMHAKYTDKYYYRYY
jgi:protein-tyrosine kinase